MVHRIADHIDAHRLQVQTRSLQVRLGTYLARPCLQTVTGDQVAPQVHFGIAVERVKRNKEAATETERRVAYIQTARIVDVSSHVGQHVCLQRRGFDVHIKRREAEMDIVYLTVRHIEGHERRRRVLSRGIRRRVPQVDTDEGIVQSETMQRELTLG